MIINIKHHPETHRFHIGDTFGTLGHGAVDHHADGATENRERFEQHGE